MVLKPFFAVFFTAAMFESDVISDGTQTLHGSEKYYQKFESDVISDGTQTPLRQGRARVWFESDVISDGTQTINGKAAGRIGV